MDDIIKDAKERFRESDSGTDYNRKTAHEDIHFARLSDQWPEAIKKQRQQENRPCLTINKLPAFIRQVVNDARQNKAAVKVHPVDSGADKDTAEVIEGLVRSIWRNGAGGDVATDTAIDHAVSGGFGFFRIGIDYAHDETFNMEAKIERIPNPLMVHWDPNSIEFDSSDWEYAFVSDFLTKDEFKKRYPKATVYEWEEGEGDYTDWMEDYDRIRIAEYWLREENTRKLIQFRDGMGQTMAVREDQLPLMAKAMAEQGGLPVEGISDDELSRLYVDMLGLEQVREREVRYHEVTRRLISGAEELEEAEPWPGSTIPICPVWGEEVMLDGRRYFRSMIRDARDPQTMFNFWRSATTELVALAPRAPFIMEEGSIPKGQEQAWATANTRSHPYLMYATGKNQPKRETFAGVPAGALQESLNASDDMKAIIGIYDPSLGARSNETSGIAIRERKMEGDVSNFHFIDNLSRAIQAAGKILVEIIPHVYTAQETIRILGEDMTEKVVRLAGENAGPAVNEETGERLLYDLATGKYDVTVKTGPSYGTQREEARDMLIEIMRAVPDSALFIGDILMEHMDFTEADKVAERLRFLLPPQIQAAEGIQPPPMAPGAMPAPMPNGQPPMQGGAAAPIPGQPGQPPANPAQGGSGF